MARYDDLIEEAAGELERVESELEAAIEQLLDLQSSLSQLRQESYAADKSRHRVQSLSFVSRHAAVSC